MKLFKDIMSWVIPIIVGLLVALLIRQFVFTFARVDGPSMEPNLINKERLIVWRHAKVKHLSVIVLMLMAKIQPPQSLRQTTLSGLSVFPAIQFPARTGIFTLTEKLFHRSSLV